MTERPRRPLHHRDDSRFNDAAIRLSRGAGRRGSEESEIAIASDPVPSIFLTPPEGGSQARLDAAESTTQTTAPKPPPASSGVPARKARVLPFLLRHGDLVLVAVVTAAAFALSAHYNLSEALRHLTRPYEALQLDELPVVMLVAALGAVWFAWRRYREARRELRQRHAAEATLATTLEENRRLARRFMDMQEAERRTLARELHDELGQYLNAIKLDAVAIENHDPTPPMRGRARSIVDNIDHVHSVVQVLIRRFRPVALDELGLQAALEHYIDHWRRRLPHTALRLAVCGDLEHCGEPANLAIYRIVQEGLTNISRHAQATQVRVQLERWTSERSGRDEVCLTIEDNGIGVASGARGSGLGLVGMRERAEALGGELRLSSAPGHGFSLTVKLPVVHEQRRP